MTNKFLPFKILTPLLFILVIWPQVSRAAEFDPNFIISDQDLTDRSAMSTSQIQHFLAGKTGQLSGYRTNNPSSQSKTAAEIIYDAAQYYFISPKFLIVTLQKEQSLVTDPDPVQYQFDWAAGYGVCDSCSTDDPGIQKYKGFFNQVNWSAKRNRYYIDTAGQWNFKVGNTYEIDGQTVTMGNQATVNLYTYTPHIHGNLLFWSIWNNWFAKNYPDGTLLQATGERGVYLIQNNKKRAFLSKTALTSRYSTTRIIIVSRNDLDAYEDGRPIKFANYSLLRSETTGRVYLLDGENKRYIESPEVFRQIGFNPEEVVVVAESELASYTDGTNINIQSIYPTGVLLQAKETGGISYVENGVRHSVWSKEILRSRFPNRQPVVVEQATIDQYAAGDPVKFRDGELVTSTGVRGVYVISNGSRRGVASKEIFNSLGYKWNNIIRTTDSALFIHPEGDPIDISY